MRNELFSERFAYFQLPLQLSAEDSRASEMKRGWVSDRLPWIGVSNATATNERTKDSVRMVCWWDMPLTLILCWTTAPATDKKYIVLSNKKNTLRTSITPINTMVSGQNVPDKNPRNSPRLR